MRSSYLPNTFTSSSFQPYSQPKHSPRSSCREASPALRIPFPVIAASLGHSSTPGPASTRLDFSRHQPCDPLESPALRILPNHSILPTHPLGSRAYTSQATQVSTVTRRATANVAQHKLTHGSRNARNRVAPPNQNLSHTYANMASQGYYNSGPQYPQQSYG